MRNRLARYIEWQSTGDELDASPISSEHKTCLSPALGLNGRSIPNSTLPMKSCGIRA